MNLSELQAAQMEQMTIKDCLPKDETEVVLHLVEEVGEVCEAIREDDREELKDEIADVLWQLNKLCWINKLDLEEVFLHKLNKNKDR
ncbi:nucleotide pyrophosphohydrolase [Patescibacteria group bacterium]|nr:nucleotide pyrophosphohydrolase [Patescibacteria group bacterium]